MLLLSPAGGTSAQDTPEEQENKCTSVHSKDQTKHVDQSLNEHLLRTVFIHCSYNFTNAVLCCYSSPTHWAVITEA